MDTIESHLLNDRQVASLLGIAVTTVRRWRLDNIGPRFVKFSASRRGLVRYRMCHIVQWLDECEKAPRKSYSKGMRQPVAERIRQLREGYNPPKAQRVPPPV